LVGANLSEAIIENARLTRIGQTRYTLRVILKDAFRRKQNRIRITRWDSVSGIDTTRTDSLTRRYIHDIAYIEDYRTQHPVLAFFWRWSCFYGQSFLLWAFWCVLVAFVFGAIYWRFDLLDLKGKLDTGFTHLYFSIVTFTTLGFGDMAPIKIGSSLAAEILVTLEVILGYIGLGGLISILANKVARRA